MSAGHCNTEAPSVKGGNPGRRTYPLRTVQLTLDGEVSSRRKALRRIRPELAHLPDRVKLAGFAAYRVKRLREQRKPEASWMPWARRYWKLYLRSSIHEKQQINAMSWGKFDVPFADVPHPNERDMPWLRPEDRV